MQRLVFRYKNINLFSLCLPDNMLELFIVKFSCWCVSLNPGLPVCKTWLTVWTLSVSYRPPSSWVFLNLIITYVITPCVEVMTVIHVHSQPMTVSYIFVKNMWHTKQKQLGVVKRALPSKVEPLESLVRTRNDINCG